MKANINLSGLTDKEIVDSRELHGDNILTPKKKEPLWKLFLEKFSDPIIKILLVAAAFSLIISITHNEYAETLGILFAIFLATGIAFWFEKDAQNKFESLNKITDFAAIKVMRNGKVTEVPKGDIVVGDIVIFETGEEIAADGMILECNSLLIDESTLTGEPSIEKTTDEAHFDHEATYPSNKLYRSTKVLEGNGIMIVESVGDKTQFGKVAEQSTQQSEESTPLSLQLDSLAKLIGVIGFLLAIVTFKILLFKELFFSENIYSAIQITTLFIATTTLAIFSTKIWLPILNDLFDYLKLKFNAVEYLLNLSWLKYTIISLIFFVVTYFGATTLIFGAEPLNPINWIGLLAAETILGFFMISVTLIVVSVPEGLPMSVTLSLALSMRRMLKTNNLVRKMHACETMGATTVICTDKTGTLTKNQMTVNEMFTLGSNKIEKGSEIYSLFAESIAMNTTAFIEHIEGEKPKTIGNPTEAALLLWCDQLGIDYEDIRANSKMIERVNFSTERKYMGTIIQSSIFNKKILLIKGAPEIIITKCSKQFIDNQVTELSEQQQVSNSLRNMQEKAMRTLAFAYKFIDENQSDIVTLAQSDMIYLGHCAISDPVREDVKGAVEECHKASIKIKVVTGDTSVTAKEIARQIGLWQDTDRDEAIITGPEFGALTDEEAYKRAGKIKIMCRARPSDKQRLVMLLQKAGEVVAVTGDGTNDAPALNRANVGLSMGSGTFIAKEASDITLLDDAFSSIISAVVWGRSLYVNIQRFIVFQLTINLTAMVIVLVGSIFGKELPLTVTQMLWVNLIMDTFAAGALASLPTDRKILNNAPRKKEAFIITPNMGKNILFIGTIFIAFMLGFNYLAGNSVYSLTLFFTSFVMLQFWNMFNAKVFSTNNSAFHEMGKSKSFLVVALLILVGQYFIVTFGGEVFRTTPLSLKDWALIFVGTSPVLWIGELYRLISRNSGSSKNSSN